MCDHLQAQAALAGAVVCLAASPGEETLLVALASARLLSFDIGRLDALQVDPPFRVLSLGQRLAVHRQTKLTSAQCCQPSTSER